MDFSKEPPHSQATNRLYEAELAKRRIAPAVADYLRWQPDGNRIIVPVLDADGQPHKRHRVWNMAPQGDQPKRLWDSDHTGDPVPRIYHPCGLVEAAKTGVLYVVGGEPDTAAFITATGCYNVICFFGEQNIPDDFPDILKAHGIHTVIDCPDLDNAGRGRAIKLRDMLTDAGLMYIPRRLPGEYRDKHGVDFGDVWAAYPGSGADFTAYLETLPLWELPERAPKPAPLPAVAPDRRADEDVARRYVQAVYTACIDRLGAAQPGERRHKLLGYAQTLAGFAHYGVYSEGEARAALLAACETNGMIKDDGRRTVEKHFDGGWKRGENAPQYVPQRKAMSRRARQRAAVADLAAVVAKRAAPLVTNRLDANEAVDLAYISDYPADTLLRRQAATLIKSALATGKTELVKRAMALLEAWLGRRPAVLYITHLQALAANIAARLDLEYYGDFSRRWMPSENLVISLNSLHKIAGAAGCYDLVIIDEVEQATGHLSGGTFRKGEAARAYEALLAVLGRADRVLALDAHATNTTRDMLAEITGGCHSIVNAYRPDRGALGLYPTEDGALTQAMKALHNGERVVITSSSREKTKAIHQYIVSTFGPAGVLLVNGETSHDQAQQDFIHHINDRLPTLRALVCSPSIATGVDVQAAVDLVVGLFDQNPLVATEQLQMLMRFRNAARRVVYVQDATGEAPESPDTIYTRQLENAGQTARAADFDGHQLAAVDPTLLDLAYIEAHQTAWRKTQQADPLAWFVALAQDEGFTIQWQKPLRNRPLRDALNAAKEAVAEAWKALVMAAAPVTPEELELHRQDGTLTPEIRAGAARYKIETTAGLSLTHRLYEDMHTTAGRRKARMFADYLSDPDVLKGLDRRDAEDRVLLSHRKHRTRQTALIEHLIIAAFGPAGLQSTEQVLADELTARVERAVAFHLDEIHRLIDRRADLSESPIPVLRRVLGSLGIRLTSQQVRHGDGHMMQYWIDPDSLFVWLFYAQARLAYLEGGGLQYADVCKNTDGSLYIREFTQPLAMQGAGPPRQPTPALLPGLGGAAAA